MSNQKKLKKAPNSNAQCSFCFMEPKINEDVKVHEFLFGYICEDCKERVSEEELGENVYKETNKSKDKNKENKNKYTPSMIFSELNKTIKGQNETLKVISFNLFKLMEKKKNLKPNNILLIGPSGTGKSEIMRQAKEQFNIPVITIPCGSLTEEGYVGLSLNDLLQSEYKKRKSLDNSIIFLDEFDKICGPNSNQTAGRGVQKQLLMLMEGEGTYIEDSDTTKEIKLKNVLFVFGGAFNKITENKFNKKSQSIGFNIDNSKNMNPYEFKREDLIKEGVEREILNRFQNICILEPLDKTIIKDIITTSGKSPIRKYTEELQMYNIRLNFEESAINYLSEYVVENRTFVRGIETKVNNLLSEILFYGPDNKEEIEINLKEEDVKNDKPIKI